VTSSAAPAPAPPEGALARQGELSLEPNLVPDRDRRALLGALLLSMIGPARARAQAAPAPAQGPAARAPTDDGLATALIEAKPALAILTPDVQTDVWSFGGLVPAATLRARRGEEFRARLVNGLDRPLSLHWHGVRLDNRFDGVAGLTQPAVAPGTSFDIRFTPPDSGTFLYRPLVIGATGELTDRGLAGLFVVEEQGARSGRPRIRTRGGRLAP
jgi:FtsP/CotA-like multicopper oxidase with cupredoxin domain